jgi:cytochrome P450
MTSPSRSPLPPGPDSGRLSQGTAFHRDPLGFLRGLRDRHGDVFTLRLAITGTVVVVADPAHMGEVVDIAKDRGHAGEARQRVLGMVSERSVLGADEDRHTSARGAVEPVFTPANMDRHRPAIREITQRHVAAWPRGRPFRLVTRMRALSDEVFIRLVVGIPDPARATALVQAVRRMLWTPGYPPLPPPGTQNAGAAGVFGKALFDRRVRPVQRLLGEEVDRRLAAARQATGTSSARFCAPAATGRPTSSTSSCRCSWPARSRPRARSRGCSTASAASRNSPNTSARLPTATRSRTPSSARRCACDPPCTRSSAA